MADSKENGKDKDIESLHYLVQSIEEDGQKTIRKILEMTRSRLVLISRLYKDAWPAWAEEKIREINELATWGYLSKKAARQLAFEEAVRWLEGYGGHPKTRDKGLALLKKRLEIPRRSGKCAGEAIGEHIAQTKKRVRESMKEREEDPEWSAIVKAAKATDVSKT